MTRKGFFRALIGAPVVAAAATKMPLTVPEQSVLTGMRDLTYGIRGIRRLSTAYANANLDPVHFSYERALIVEIGGNVNATHIKAFARRQDRIAHLVVNGIVVRASQTPNGAFPRFESQPSILECWVDGESVRGQDLSIHVLPEFSYSLLDGQPQLNVFIVYA